MDVTKIKRMIGQCSDHKELDAVLVAVKDRQKAIRKRILEDKCAKALAWAKTLKQGDTIYCAMPGTCLWKGYQHGDALTVWHWQPRKKILWFDFDGLRYWASVAGIVDRCLQAEKPAGKIDRLNREAAAGLGEIFREELTR